MHGHNIHSLAAINYPTFPRRNSLPPSSHQYSGNSQRLFIDNPKISKDFFACRIFLTANHQHPKKFKDLFACQNVLAANHQHPEILKDFPESKSSIPAASNNHPASSIPAATSNHPATSNSNQQQQAAAATSSSKQQKQATATTSFHPTSSTYTFNAGIC